MIDIESYVAAVGRLLLVALFFVSALGKLAVGNAERPPRCGLSIQRAHSSGGGIMTQTVAIGRTEQPVVFVIDDDASVRELVAGGLYRVAPAQSPGVAAFDLEQRLLNWTAS